MSDLRRKVRLAFYGLLAADEQVALADAVLSVAERVQQVAQARFEEGAAPRLDVMAAELGVVRARTDLELAQSARRSTQADLNALLNRPPGLTLAIAGETADVPPIPFCVGILPLASLRNAEFLHNEIPGMQIPKAVMERMAKAATRRKDRVLENRPMMFSSPSIKTVMARSP